MQVTLKPLSKGRPIVFDKTILLIGRHAGCDVILQRSRKISRKHCCLARSGDRLLIRDLGSMNGVWVNGTRVRCEAELQIGDEIAIGDLVYRLEETKNGRNGRRQKAKNRGVDAKSSEQAAAPSDPLPLDLSQDVPIPIPEESQSFLVEPSKKELEDEQPASESAEEVI